MKNVFHSFFNSKKQRKRNKRNKSGDDDAGGSDRSVSAIEQERVASEEGEGERKKAEEEKTSNDATPPKKKNNPYSYLEDGPDVGVGKNFTAAQKQKMLEENMKRNGGVVKSDNPNDMYQILKKPKKSQKGVTPDPDEWQFDHIIPKDKGGTNSFSNCQIVSRKFNRQKWNK